MKKCILVSFSFVLIFACTTQRKVTYEFPFSLPEALKARYVLQCDQGKLLYDKNCAGCHNTVVKGRRIIPDFSQEKLVSYAMRTANKKHESNMSEKVINETDLELIMTFLTYKKKNSKD